MYIYTHTHIYTYMVYILKPCKCVFIFCLPFSYSWTWDVLNYFLFRSMLPYPYLNMYMVKLVCVLDFSKGFWVLPVPYLKDYPYFKHRK